jgi:hypothetical protein
MSHAWIAVTHLDEQGYQNLKAEREEREERDAKALATIGEVKFGD